LGVSVVFTGNEETERIITFVYIYEMSENELRLSRVGGHDIETVSMEILLL
jgi:hypothetical protein